MNCDEPINYIDSTLLLASCKRLESARKTAIWEDATLEQLQDEELLKERLPNLIEEFIEVVESLGFIY